MDVISAGAGAADVVLQAVSVPAGCLLPGKEPVAWRLQTGLPAPTGTWGLGPIGGHGNAKGASLWVGSRASQG